MNRYVVLPKADEDLEQQAYYYAKEASPEIGHRFLASAHATFVLLAGQPHMGWHCRLKHAQLLDLRLFRVSGFEKILILYRPLSNGVEIVRVVQGSRNLQRYLTGV